MTEIVEETKEQTEADALEQVESPKRGFRIFLLIAISFGLAVLITLLEKFLWMK